MKSKFREKNLKLNFSNCPTEHTCQIIWRFVSWTVFFIPLKVFGSCDSIIENDTEIIFTILLSHCQRPLTGVTLTMVYRHISYNARCFHDVTVQIYSLFFITQVKDHTKLKCCIRMPCIISIYCCFGKSWNSL